MKRCVHSWLVVLVILLFGSVACDKHTAQRLAGRYASTVAFSSWDMTPSNFDTVYTSEVEIEQDYKHLIIGGQRIHVDSVRNERRYRQGTHNDYVEVQFKKKGLLYLYIYSGGLGGGGSYTITGTKIDE